MNDNERTTLWWTNAPTNYDYWYVATVFNALSAEPVDLSNRGVPPYDRHAPTILGWRLIEVTDADRFERYQRPRYASGRHIAFRMTDELAEIHNLPKV